MSGVRIFIEVLWNSKRHARNSRRKPIFYSKPKSAHLVRCDWCGPELRGLNRPLVGLESLVKSFIVLQNIYANRRRNSIIFKIRSSLILYMANSIRQYTPNLIKIKLQFSKNIQELNRSRSPFTEIYKIFRTDWPWSNFRLTSTM